ncbi:mitochondrial inner membrane protease subunit 1 isoform X2 [Haemaphysalis longicornis]
MQLLHRILSRCLRASGFVVQTAAVAYCVVEFCGDLVICSGSSMEPTIASNDILLTEHISVHTNNIRRGDIIIAKCPNNPRQYICKRVVGVHGDQLVSGFFVQRIPKGHVWLEGDNKENSTDSRSYGPVPLGLIRGRAVCRVYPYRKATFFRSESY